MPALGQEHLVPLLVHGEIARLGHTLAGTRVFLTLLSLQLRHHGVDRHIHIGMVFRLPADDQGRARFVDQNRIHLVHDRVVQCALHPVCRLVDHVVAQIVKTVFVVGAVGDVGVVGRLLFLARHAGVVDTNAQPQKVIQAPHPLRVAGREIVVDGHHMHAAPRQGVEVHRQRRGQGFAFARAHLGNLALVQSHTAHQLHIKVAHFHDPLGTFAYHRKGFWQQIIEALPTGEPLLELLCLGLQRLVRERLQGPLHGIDAGDGTAVLLEKAVVTAAENFGEEIEVHGIPTITRSNPFVGDLPRACVSRAFYAGTDSGLLCRDKGPA